FVVVEGRVKAPLVDLKLLRNQILVGATLAILIVAGTINALMYVLSLYFQNPSAFGMSALETGFATLPAGAAMILVTPLITPIAVKIGTRFAIVAGFGLSAIGFGVLAFVHASWAYAAFIAPLAVIAAGLGLANGPASSASTSAVPADQVGQASGISNMARYIGAALFVAFTATIYNSVQVDHEKSGASASDALAAALSRVSLVLAVCSAAGIAVALLMARHHQRKAKAVDRVAAAAAVVHTVPTQPV